MCRETMRAADEGICELIKREILHTYLDCFPASCDPMFPIDDFQNTVVSTDVSPLSVDLHDNLDFKQCSFLRLRSDTEISMLASGAPVFQMGEASAELRRGEKENEKRLEKRWQKQKEGRCTRERERRCCWRMSGKITGRNPRERKSGERKGRRKNVMRPEDDLQNTSFRSFRSFSEDPG